MILSSMKFIDMVNNFLENVKKFKSFEKELTKLGLENAFCH
jgi:hypothetical protein